MSLEVGQTLKVLRGAFKGMDAKIIALRGNEADVIVSIFGRETPATLSAADLGGKPLERVADRLLVADAKLGHQLRMRAYWDESIAETEEERVDAWIRFLDVRSASEDRQRDEEAASIAALATEFPDDAEALRAVEGDGSRWRPHRVALKRLIAAGQTTPDFQRSDDAERAHWRATTLDAVPPDGWAASADAAMTIQEGKDFRAEVFRTMGCMQDAVRKYGLAGLRAVWPRMYGEGRIIELAELPEGHIWHGLAGLSPQDAVRRLFPEGHCIADVLMRLRGIFAIAHDEVEVEDKTQLLYLLDAFEVHYEDGQRKRMDLPAFVLANPPATDDKLDPYSTKLGWTLPLPLRTLYAVHDGIGRTRVDDAHSILSTGSLRVLGEMMNPIVEKQNDVPTDYRYDDLLGFYQDGTGNGQYFHRETDGMTRDWDHETRQVGPPESFEEFCRERLPVVWLGIE